MPQGTVAIILARDYTMLDDKLGNAFGGVLIMADSMKVRGIKVELIGDGKTNLSLDYIKQRLSAIKDPNAMLYIGAHGGDGSIIGNSVLTIGGVSADNWLFDSNDASELYKIVPPNFKTVIQDSCHSGAAIQQAYENLPKGTVFLPLGGNNTIYGSYWNATPTIYQYKPYIASDLYLQLVIEAHEKFDLGLDNNGIPIAIPSKEEREKLSPYDQKRWANRIEKFDLSRMNMPTHAVVAGERIQNIAAGLALSKGNHYSDAMLDWWSEHLHNVLMTVDERSIREGLDSHSNQLVLNGNEDAYYAQMRRPMLRRIADKITAGTLKQGDPDYAIGYAMVYRAIEDEHPEFGLRRNDKVIQEAKLSDERLVGNHFKYYSEIRGVLSQLSPSLKRQIMATPLGKEMGLTGKIEDDVYSAIFAFKDHGVARAEQFGNHDDEITLPEFIEKLNQINAKLGKGRAQ